MARDADFLVIGSGIAGLSFALRAAPHGSVRIVTKKGRSDSATNWAQGGIAAVMSPQDSVEAHVQDTLRVGGGLCHEDVVRFVIEGGTRYLAYLLKRFRGDLRLALAAYHAGERTVRRYSGVPPYRETRRYVSRVLTLSKRYDAEFR